MKNNVLPRVYAGEILLELCINKMPIDVYKICNTFNIEITYDELKTCDGGFLLNAGRKKIVINSNVGSESKKRFTIAHELGHYFLPNHKGIAYNCIIKDQTLGDSSLFEEEREANEFASELLMPTKIFKEIIAHVNIDLNIPSAVKIAKYFNVSKIAAAIKLLQFFNDEKALLVYSHKGKIIWSLSFLEEKLNLISYRIPPLSLTFETLANAAKNEVRCKVLSSKVWLDTDDDYKLSEEVLCYKDYPVRLTLLKLIET